MRFPRHDDPTDRDDPDNVRISTTGIPRALFWGLAKGALMLGAVAVISWVTGTALQNRAQERAQEEGQIALQRDQAVQGPVVLSAAPTRR